MLRLADWLNPRPCANSCSRTRDEIVLRAVVVVEPEVEVEVGAEVGDDVVAERRIDTERLRIRDLTRSNPASLFASAT